MSQPKSYRLGKAVFREVDKIDGDRYYQEEDGEGEFFLSEKCLLNYGATPIPEDKGEGECTCVGKPPLRMQRHDCPTHGIKLQPPVEEIEPPGKFRTFESDEMYEYLFNILSDFEHECSQIHKKNIQADVGKWVEKLKVYILAQKQDAYLQSEHDAEAIRPPVEEIDSMPEWEISVDDDLCIRRYHDTCEKLNEVIKAVNRLQKESK